MRAERLSRNLLGSRFFLAALEEPMDAAAQTRVRPIAPEDLSSILALNNAHALELSLADAEKLQKLVSAAALATAIGPPGDPDAFLIAFDDRTPSQGPNHAWFLARHARFLYVDRVCVHARARRRGRARALYSQAIVEAGRRAIPILCCEVNSDPPNPGSDAFHASFGFAEVGRAQLPDRGKSVRYLECLVYGVDAPFPDDLNSPPRRERPSPK